ncbi:MAG: hypothetical protein JSR44_08540 [Spirochaetes bacterium]|nr:hypothetical protein [Spirochaetota bacterium]
MIQNSELKIRQGRAVVVVAVFALLALWLLITGTPLENTLSLAAERRVGLDTLLFYQYRDAALFEKPLGFAANFMLAVIGGIGSRVWWGLILLLQAALLTRARLVTQLVFIAFAAAVPFWGEPILVWSSAWLLLIVAVRLLRRLFPWRQNYALLTKTILTVVATVFFFAIATSLASPLQYLKRQQTLGGVSTYDLMRAYRFGQRIELKENCVAVINPPDLRGVNSLELITRKSLQSFSAIGLLDLKVVAENYRLLGMKDAQGRPLFSDAARAYAAREMALAARLMPEILRAPQLCLIANFDTLPAAEKAPYSRARAIQDARRKLGLDTKVVQLSNN